MENQRRGIDRRTVVKRSLAVGGAVWVAPAVLTLETAGAEFSPPGATTLYLRSSSSPLGSMSLSTGGVSAESKTILMDAGTVTGQTDDTKRQGWSYQAPVGGLTIDSTIELRLWTTGESNTTLEFTAAVYRTSSNTLPPDGTYTQLGSTGSVSWSTGPPGQRSVSFGAIDTTIPVGEYLMVKIVNNDSVSEGDWDALWDSGNRDSHLFCA